VACELPARHDRPLGRFSRTELHRLVVEQGVTDASATTIWRWLHDRSIKPWQQRSWIFPRDPDFQPKAGRVLDLYARRFEGRRLHPGEYVICADEKSQLQALARRHETVPAASGRPALVEFEYRRGGTLAYLAAWDVHHARLFGRCEPKTGIDPFGRLVEQVMSNEPYASAKTVFWVVDNGSSHAGHRSIDRLEGTYPNARLIHLPIHASWLNQIEIYFSILQRKALTPNDFSDLDAVAARIVAFEDHYRQIAKPFEWTFTRSDLDALLGRFAAREPHPGRRPRHPGTHRDRLDHARAQQLPRPAGQIDQRDRRQKPTAPARIAQRDHRPRKPRPHKGRVEPVQHLVDHRLASQLIVLGDRLTQPPQRGRQQLRKLDLQRQIQARQIDQLREQHGELALAQRPRRLRNLPRRRPQERHRQALT